MSNKTNHSGLVKFQKGVSGNPGGVPKNEVKKLAREHTEEALERLVYWMRSDNASASVAATNLILDRGWGKAEQALTGAGGEGAGLVVQVVRFSDRAAVPTIEHDATAG